ncbi:hypothetical protein PSDVSF_15210 [Pseudodesulfovibrio sediminis]|uniref:Uncharacterized protein n=1 Tax=Pseudodesulfovibrio sediminis TaxID=2810563 RepID=A0ABN6ESR6_9BACT|nr:hypothetical protein PSDVSF_15210 [Pseudodesulfovibrio sediminis]
MNVDNIIEGLIIGLGLAVILCLFRAVRIVLIAVVKSPYTLVCWLKGRAIEWEYGEFDPTLGKYPNKRKAGWFKRHGIYIKK